MQHGKSRDLHKQPALALRKAFQLSKMHKSIGLVCFWSSAAVLVLVADHTTCAGDPYPCTCDAQEEATAAKVGAVVAVGRLVAYGALPQHPWLAPALVSRYMAHGKEVADTIKDVCRCTPAGPRWLLQSAVLLRNMISLRKN